ncbi:caspase domain-containing protein [Lactarius akahatsu]|uniref:Caspase domain-containing protein n=1 Tax=Lactarius akahatsu TaxID=416441 RepID=A0AAD4QEW6_9AGAM|nr:caspase domain-containing protein [Lactarius akahatsu]
MGSFLSSIYSRYFSFCFRRINQVINPNGRIRLPDVEEGKQQGTRNGPTTKRRALLVGISYAWSQSDAWWPLENPHADVDLFWSLLVGAYGYSPEDITVLKDGPNIPDLLQPTRANMIRELERLVSGAASGDKFTFFYSGHSDQQKSRDGLDVEEDGQDEVIVTSDLGRIVDNELNDILVKPLPAGCFLLSVFDTCHSGTMLDLPHHHCNGVYVPWHSKGERAMPTMRNKIVRNQAMGPSALHDPAFQIPSIVGVMARNIDNNIRLYTDPLPSPCAQLRIDTQVGGSADEANRRWMSMGDSEGYPPREGRRLRSCVPLVSPTRYESPVSIVKCDGWCHYDPFVRKTVLSLSACSDPQRAWEGPRGSLTTVLCKYLKTQPRPSYRDLMSHVNFALHENARELHAYTREQKKREARGEGNGFDGELDNFQEPKLSSLAKLNMDDVFQL